MIFPITALFLTLRQQRLIQHPSPLMLYLYLSELPQNLQSIASTNKTKRRLEPLNTLKQLGSYRLGGFTTGARRGKQLTGIGNSLRVEHLPHPLHCF